MTTQFLHRGEQLRHESELGVFEAECVWPSTEDGERIYPIELFVRSIRHASEKDLSLNANQRAEVAARMKQELEASESTLSVILCE